MASKNIFERLSEYYQNVAKKLKYEAETAAVFPNGSDKGDVREKIYVNFLKAHVPGKCHVTVGGFVFDEDGAESKQIDILVTSENTPRFSFGANELGKTFSPIEGLIAAVSVKSNLNKEQLHDALWNIASIPRMGSLNGKVNPNLNIRNYDDWPTKIIYASSGLTSGTVYKHLTDFYLENPDIPLCRRPNMIHVAGICTIIRSRPEHSITDLITGEKTLPQVGHFNLFGQNPDLHGMMFALREIQDIASASSHIIYPYNYLLDKVHEASVRKGN